MTNRIPVCAFHTYYLQIANSLGKLWNLIDVEQCIAVTPEYGIKQKALDMWHFLSDQRRTCLDQSCLMFYDPKFSHSCLSNVPNGPYPYSPKSGDRGVTA